MTTNCRTVVRTAIATLGVSAALGLTGGQVTAQTAPTASPATPAPATTPTAAPAPQATAAPAVRVRPAAQTLDAVRRDGVLRVGIVVIPPWAMTTRTGELVGFDVDVARRLAADLGVRLELVRTTLDGYAGDLAVGRFDVGIGGLWPNPRDALLANFSDTYAVNTIELVAHPRRLGAKPAAAAIDRPGIKIGTRAGSHSERIARQRFPRADVVTFTDDDKFIGEFQQGRLDAIVAVSPVDDWLAMAGGKNATRPLPPLETRREAFAIERGDADFLAYLNAWIVHHSDSGWLPERRKYWFRSLDWLPTIQ
jgi:polar amino acid transport system substrate-binding protein